MKVLINRVFDWLRINTRSPYDCYWSRRALNAEARVKTLEYKLRDLETLIEKNLICKKIRFYDRR